ncbi:hypothetical protein [Tenggerimyces flavus]|uniref:Uncharacterized protein n=1 Tax=Tenggerimyces flavus TaxID=1708749 RepID=A0ABV7Y809_9ACTN|nr:hypothetical protein [Tenggerimyces flavus]MBM7788633.1 hypothetical protein [Tenggerimyces flavus]
MRQDGPSEEAVELALHSFLAEHTEALTTALAEVQANGSGRGAEGSAEDDDYVVTGVTAFAAAGEPLDRGVVLHTRHVDIQLVIRLRAPAA